MVAPMVNYRWPSIPKSLMQNDYRREVAKWSVWVANYFPGLLKWLVTQNLFSTTNSMLEKNPVYFNDQDIEVLKHNTKGFPMLTKVNITLYQEEDYNPLVLFPLYSFRISPKVHPIFIHDFDLGDQIIKPCIFNNLIKSFTYYNLYHSDLYTTQKKL